MGWTDGKGEKIWCTLRRRGTKALNRGCVGLWVTNGMYEESSLLCLESEKRYCGMFFSSIPCQVYILACSFEVEPVQTTQVSFTWWILFSAIFGLFVWGLFFASSCSDVLKCTLFVVNSRSSRVGLIIGRY